MRITVFVTAMALCAISCNVQESYRKNEDGVTISIRNGETRTMILTVLSEKIIRVSAAPSDTITAKESLVALSRPAFNNWKVEENDAEVVVSTAMLKASVSTETGEVKFMDSEGAPILEEVEGGGKNFISGKDSTGYAIRQVFESPDDEAFYGLGQHQNRQMNYKGEDVELAQHNIVAVVPFLYSSRNYGILWDNYSITRFGDPRPYQMLDKKLRLFDADGNPGGLTARYFSGQTLVAEETVKEINHQYLECKTEPVNYATPHGRIVYEGSFSSPLEGEHKFKLYASGYFKLWIDGELKMDKWRQGWNPWYNNFTVDMVKDEARHIKIEWDLAGAPYIALEHQEPLPAGEQGLLSLSSETGNMIDYYFIKGDNADDVISGYRDLTGKSPILPKWALGLWQSRERYRNQDELIDVVKEFRERQIPLDNIVLDWQYWEDPKWGSHEFDLKRFPDPAAMVDQLHNDLNTRIMISVWPKYNVGTQHYNEMNEKGYLYPHNVEKGRLDWVGPGYKSTFYDAFNPGARNMFWNQINEHLNSLEIDAWWLDATEPDMHSNLSIDERKLNMTPNFLGTGEEFFNAYSLMNAKGIYEGERETDPDKRAFILTRSAFAGQQRYAAVTWSGDIVSRWSDLADQIPAGINFSLSGLPNWTTDIGGFAVEPRYERPNAADLNEWRELNVRWFQFGAFTPLFRVHGQFPYREMFNIAPEGHPAYQTMLYYDKLRYRLMPYIYSLAGMTWHKDYTIMRGLVMDYPADAKARNIWDEFMFGPSLLVAPVYEYQAGSRTVYLPSGNGWYDFYTGKYLDGGEEITADAPLEKIPLYIREGSILPFGPEIQYTSEKPADPLILFVFAGADGKFDLYEDEGVNYNYENGSFSTIPFSYSDTDKTLTIGERKGSFDGMLQERNIHVVWIDKDSGYGVDLSKEPDATAIYMGSELTIGVD